MFYRNTFFSFLLFSITFSSLSLSKNPGQGNDKGLSLKYLPSFSLIASAVAENPCENTENYPDPLGISLDDLKDKLIALRNDRDRFKYDVNASDEEKEVKSKDLSACQRKINDYEETLEDLESETEECKEAGEKTQEAGRDFSQSCAFVGGRQKCATAIRACDKCPSPENFGSYDCVQIHNESQCPALSGKALEEAKETREELEEDMEELKKDIEELEKDIVSKENEINDALAEVETEFKTLTRELETETESAKNELEEGLQKGKAQIDESLAKQISEVQAQINQRLKIAHSFENAIRKASREYRQERRQIIMECEVQAKAELAKLRQKRRAAIQTGSLSYSLSSYMNPGRRSFAQIDSNRFKKLNAQCLARRKEDFSAVKENYDEKLTIIDQQKKEYLEALRIQKQQLDSLNQAAQKAGQTLLADYSKQMSRILENHNKLYTAAIEDYSNSKNTINKKKSEIFVLQKGVRVKKQELKIKQSAWVREAELINYLKSKGVSKSEDGETFGEAMSAYAELDDAVAIAKEACRCTKKSEKNPLHRFCKDIIQKESYLHKENEEEESSSSYEEGTFDENRASPPPSSENSTGHHR